MLPTVRFYFFLLLGVPLAILLSLFVNNQVSILAIIIYDVIILILTIWDGVGVRNNKVTITRQPLVRLSVGKNNHVNLEVTTKQRATIQVKDDYPKCFIEIYVILSTDKRK